MRKSKKIIEKIWNGADYWFTFVTHPEVEPTNNRAARALREHVVQRKIIGTFRNEKSTSIYETIMTMLATWNNEGSTRPKCWPEAWSKRGARAKYVHVKMYLFSSPEALNWGMLCTRVQCQNAFIAKSCKFKRHKFDAIFHRSNKTAPAKHVRNKLDSGACTQNCSEPQAISNFTCPTN